MNEKDMHMQTLALRQNTMPALVTPASATSLEAYIQYTHSIPMLEEAEEKALAERLKLKNDIAAAQKLIMAHLRFVVKIARGFAGYGLPMADLIQEGNIGLMKAVKRFNPEVGVRLVTFAVHWIKAEMHEFIIRNWRIVKIATTKAQRKLFFNLRNAKKRLGWFSKSEIQDVANELNVKPSEVVEIERRMNAYDAAFDASESDDDECNTFAPAQYLESTDASPEEIAVEGDWEDQTQTRLKYAIDALDARSQDIINQRWLAEKKATLHDLAAKYAVSAERIRQLEQQAIGKLKNAIAA